jgi:hypothetical protein
MLKTFKDWFLIRENCSHVSRQVMYWANRKKDKSYSPGYGIRTKPVSQGNASWQFLEQVFEEIRKKVAPSHPSRVAPNAFYVCRTPKQAQQWAGDRGKVWEVEVSGNVCDCDPEIWTEARIRVERIFNYLVPPLEELLQHKEALEEARGWAKEYWTNKPDPEFDNPYSSSMAEVLVNGTGSIIGPYLAEKETGANSLSW